MEHSVLGIGVRPVDFASAAARHGRHFARYLYAARHAGGRSVLDVACGGGYGSAYLATAARSVLGMDLDDAMLQHARTHFVAPNLQFRKHDLHEPIDDEPFNLICCFETLEHVRDPLRCVRNLAACLASEGVALISVPNGEKEVTSRVKKDYHQARFSREDVERLLRACFEQVQLLSQVYHKGLGHYVRTLMLRPGHHARDYRFVPGLQPEAKTWLAVCRL